MPTLPSKAFDPEALFIEAERYEEEGAFEKAFKCLLAAAKAGHTGSQVNLGSFYSAGKGVHKSSKDAAYWYQQAYKNGDGTGAFNLAVDKRNEGNLRAAIRWFKRAVDMRYGEAAVELAKLYMSRRGGKPVAVELLKSVQSMKRYEISEDAKEESLALLSSLT